MMWTNNPSGNPPFIPKLKIEAYITNANFCFGVMPPSPKIVDMYSRYLRQISVFFDTCLDVSTASELKTYFLSLVET